MLIVGVKPGWCIEAGNVGRPGTVHKSLDQDHSMRNRTITPGDLAMSMSRRLPNAMLVAAAFTLASAGSAAAQKFSLTSSDVHAGQKIAAAQVFSGMGCTGSNVSPALEWHGAPAKAKSFAVTVYDPDAPTGSGWWHWVVFNIPANVTKLPAGAGDASKHLLPAGASQGTTDFGTAG